MSRILEIIYEFLTNDGKIKETNHLLNELDTIKNRHERLLTKVLELELKITKLEIKTDKTDT